MGDNFGHFRAIDAVPQIETREIKSIEDLGIFAVPLARTQELIVDPDKIDEVLALIHKAQLPQMEEIRQRDRLRAGRDAGSTAAGPRQVFHAQVLSIAA